MNINTFFFYSVRLPGRQWEAGARPMMRAVQAIMSDAMGEPAWHGSSPTTQSINNNSIPSDFHNKQKCNQFGLRSRNVMREVTCLCSTLPEQYCKSEVSRGN